MHPSNMREDVHGLDGPDYVALVIEWDDDNNITMVSERAAPPAMAARGPMLNRTVVTVLGALGAIALTTWGLRHLRA